MRIVIETNSDNLLPEDWQELRKELDEEVPLYFRGAPLEVKVEEDE